MSSLYKKNIIDHYKNPRNFKSLKTYNKRGFLSNTTCGDELEVFMYVKKSIIEDIGFQGSGCAISIASMSMLTEHIKGKNFNLITNLSDLEIFEMIGINKDTPRSSCVLLGLKTCKAVNDT